MIVRTLAQRFLLRTWERRVFEAILFLECNPEITPPSAGESVFTVEPFRGRYRICQEGTVDAEVLGLRAVVNHLHGKLISSSLQGTPYTSTIRAASLRRGPRRVLLAGRQAAGKTTLALRLLQAGYDFEGHEHVLLDEDGVIARPLPCWIKEPSLALLPAVAPVIATSPVHIDYLGRKTFNVDPRVIGASWQIKKGRAHCIIVLHPNHGGYSSLRPLSPLALSQSLISGFGAPKVDLAASIGAIARLASASKGYDLSLGDPDSAVRCVERAVDE